jgi:hypothetical protein
MKLTSICIAAAILTGAMLLSACSSTSSSSSSSSAGTSSSAASSSSSGSKRSTDNSQLSVEKVQAAVDRALDRTKKGGRAAVSGVQELPQENTARADIRFDGFQFNADMYGTPISKDKKTPPEPAIKDPKFYEKMYQNRAGQTRIETYSGQGTATLKHYNDGRWVLTGVQFGMNGTNANVEIR